MAVHAQLIVLFYPVLDICEIILQIQTDCIHFDDSRSDLHGDGCFTSFYHDYRFKYKGFDGELSLSCVDAHSSKCVKVFDVAIGYQIESSLVCLAVRGNYEE